MSSLKAASVISSEGWLARTCYIASPPMLLWAQLNNALRSFPQRILNIFFSLKVWWGSNGKLRSGARLQLLCSVIALNMLGSTHPTTPQPHSGLLLPARILVQETQKQLLNVSGKDFALTELMDMLKSRRTSLESHGPLCLSSWVVLIDFVYHYWSHYIEHLVKLLSFS